MIVGVCGLGYTGSGAVMDLLNEYEGVQIQDGDEFGITYRPDGLEDLSYHLLQQHNRYMSGDAAIYRYRELIKYAFGPRTSLGKGISDEVLKITDEFIEDICQVTWPGTWGFDAYNHTRIYNSVKGHLAIPIAQRLASGKEKERYPYRKMFLSINPDDFYIKARNYVSKIIKLMGYDESGLLVMNQLFSGDAPEKGFCFFEDAKAIVVDKDPRDLYFLGKYVVHSQCTWMPTSNVEDFITYYKSIRSNINKGNENVLYIRFEDLIYEYERTVNNIEAFLGLSSTLHIRSKSSFKPELSKNNTQLFRKYRNDHRDIERIEKELSEWLYPYDRYEKIEVFGESF